MLTTKSFLINKVYCVTIILLSFTVNIFSQTIPKNNFSKTYIKKCIIEIFQDKSNDLVFNSNTKTLQLINNFFEHKITVKYMPNFELEYELISNLSLNNKFNTELKADKFYDPDTFNPLKYKFPKGLKKFKHYRIGNSNYYVLKTP